MHTRVARLCLLLLLALTALAALIHPLSAGTGKSLAEQVTIRRDNYGVPHVMAETEEAAAFGIGFAQAEDHPVELARRYVVAQGESARVFGAGAVESDFRMKRYGNYEVARARFHELTPLFQAMMKGYAAGFNLYAEKHRKELPEWVPTFDEYGVLAMGRAEVMRFAFNDAMISGVQLKYPADNGAAARVGSSRDYSQTPATTEGEESQAGSLRYGEDLMGSNMWAISGSRTNSGKPILLGNPHQPWSALYWEAHITVPGKVNFYGSTFIGRPVLTTGFNEHLGWSHTVNYPDLADIYVLTLDPNNREQYVFDGKPMPLTRKEITVEVKQPDGKLSQERRTYYYSHLGPIVHRTAKDVFALKSAILDEFRYYEEWYALSKSKSLQEFTANLKQNHIPMFNIAYADADGNIAYWWNGTVPRRVDDGMDYSAEVPGATSKYVWKELHKTEELPQLINPSGGYVQNCNDPPWWTSLRNLLDPAKYPSYSEPGRRLQLRSQMSLEMMESQQKFSLDDVKRLKYNQKMLLADRVKPDLIKAIKSIASPSEDLKRGLAVLEAWDNTVARASRGGVLFRRFWDSYAGSSKTPYAVAWDSKNPGTTPRGLSNPELAVTSFEDAVRWTRKTYGSENVAWGEVHRLRLGDLDLPVGGESGLYGLFRVMTFAAAPGGKLVVGTVERGKPMQGGGDGWVFAVEFSKPIVAYSVLAYGETSNTASKHSTDQAALFANEGFKKALFSEAEIKKNIERSYHPGE
ncbi:MAG: penicillin acylase family protein [Acidobacteriota bacterium]